MDGDIHAQLDQMMAFIATQFEKSDARTNARFESLEREMRNGFRAVDQRFDRLEARMDALKARMDALEARMDALETRVTEGFLAVSDCFATAELRREQIEGRVTSWMLEVEHRLNVISLDLKEHLVVVNGRLDALSARIDALSATVESLAKALDVLHGRVIEVGERTDHGLGEVLSRLVAVEEQLAGLSERTDGLSADMLQRFRLVNDRLGEIDRRLAA